MMKHNNNNMDFVGMKKITKITEEKDKRCSDWVATEKVHGSSFQFYTSDGIIIQVGSRRRRLDPNGSFLKCNIRDLLNKYENFIKRLWQIVAHEEEWKAYRLMPANRHDDEDDEDDEDEAEEETKDVNEEGEKLGETAEKEEEGEDKGLTGLLTESRPIKSELSQEEATARRGVEVEGFPNSDANQKEGENTSNLLPVRIYGELYGGGGVEKDLASAVQKEIIYSDDFRFYVFAITVNKKWMSVSELNQLCHRAGFPYYAKPMCEPKATAKELMEWLVKSDFLNTRSRLTDRTDDRKTYIEGVVMTPLTRNDFRFHTVKLLAPAFTDVREALVIKGGMKAKKFNYCTKARYHSVLSKLDFPEREQTDMVADMFIADIMEANGGREETDSLKQIWRTVVIKWLTEDGYHRNATATQEKGSDIIADASSDDDGDAGCLFDILS